MDPDAREMLFAALCPNLAQAAEVPAPTQATVPLHHLVLTFREDLEAAQDFPVVEVWTDGGRASRSGILSELGDWPPI